MGKLYMKINHLGTIIIETEHLVLKKAGFEDLSRIYENMLGDEMACSICGCHFYTNKNDFFQNSDSLLNLKDNEYIWTIFKKNKNIPIGCISVHSQDDENFNCSIGYSIHPNFQNFGYCTEALKEVIKFLINEVGYYRICCKYRGDNIASKRVMEKSGFKFEGTERDSLFKNVQFIDRHVYSIIKSDLFSSK